MIIIKKLYLLLLFVCVLLASSNIVNAKESKYVNENVWDPIENAYKQKALFTGKQIYDWTEYDENYDRSMQNSPYGDTEAITINYDQDLPSTYYKQDHRQGIALKQNLKNDNLDHHNCDLTCENYNVNGYFKGHVVTGLQLSLEANFDNLDSNSFGLFYGGAKHQESYVSIDISQVTFTYQPPYVSIPIDSVTWGKKYEDGGLGADVLVPIN